MAAITPSLSTIRGMTTGERRFGRRLEALLEDDYTVWYDIPVGRQRRYPDLIILHPSRVLLFLEVKDWKLATLKKISKGLEFETVILSGIGALKDGEEDLARETRLLYVGMTRAKQQLFVTSGGANQFTARFQKLSGIAA